MADLHHGVSTAEEKRRASSARDGGRSVAEGGDARQAMSSRRDGTKPLPSLPVATIHEGMKRTPDGGGGGVVTGGRSSQRPDVPELATPVAQAHSAKERREGRKYAPSSKRISVRDLNAVDQEDVNILRDIISALEDDVRLGEVEIERVTFEMRSKLAAKDEEIRGVREQLALYRSEEEGKVVEELNKKLILLEGQLAQREKEVDALRSVMRASVSIPTLAIPKTGQGVEEELVRKDEQIRMMYAKLRAYEKEVKVVGDGESVKLIKEINAGLEEEMKRKDADILQLRRQVERGKQDYADAVTQHREKEKKHRNDYNRLQLMIVEGPNGENIVEPGSEIEMLSQMVTDLEADLEESIRESDSLQMRVIELQEELGEKEQRFAETRQAKEEELRHKTEQEMFNEKRIRDLELHIHQLEDTLEAIQQSKMVEPPRPHPLAPGKSVREEEVQDLRALVSSLQAQVAERDAKIEGLRHSGAGREEEREMEVYLLRLQINALEAELKAQRVNLDQAVQRYTARGKNPASARTGVPGYDEGFGSMEDDILAEIIAGLEHEAMMKDMQLQTLNDRLKNLGGRKGGPEPVIVVEEVPVVKEELPVEEVPALGGFTRADIEHWRNRVSALLAELRSKERYIELLQSKIFVLEEHMKTFTMFKERMDGLKKIEGPSDRLQALDITLHVVQTEMTQSEDRMKQMMSTMQILEVDRATGEEERQVVGKARQVDASRLDDLQHAYDALSERYDALKRSRDAYAEEREKKDKMADLIDLKSQIHEGVVRTLVIFREKIADVATTEGSGLPPMITKATSDFDASWTESKMRMDEVSEMIKSLEGEVKTATRTAQGEAENVLRQEIEIQKVELEMERKKGEGMKREIEGWGERLKLFDGRQNIYLSVNSAATFLCQRVLEATKTVQGEAVQDLRFAVQAVDQQLQQQRETLEQLEARDKAQAWEIQQQAMSRKETEAPQQKTETHEGAMRSGRVSLTELTKLQEELDMKDEELSALAVEHAEQMRLKDETIHFLNENIVRLDTQLKERVSALERECKEKDEALRTALTRALEREDEMDRTWHKIINVTKELTVKNKFIRQLQIQVIAGDADAETTAMSDQLKTMLDHLREEENVQRAVHETELQDNPADDTRERYMIELKSLEDEMALTDAQIELLNQRLNELTTSGILSEKAFLERKIGMGHPEKSTLMAELSENRPLQRAPAHVRMLALLNGKIRILQGELGAKRLEVEQLTRKVHFLTEKLEHTTPIVQYSPPGPSGSATGAGAGETSAPRPPLTREDKAEMELMHKKMEFVLQQFADKDKQISILQRKVDILCDRGGSRTDIKARLAEIRTAKSFDQMLVAVKRVEELVDATQAQLEDVDRELSDIQQGPKDVEKPVTPPPQSVPPEIKEDESIREHREETERDHMARAITSMERELAAKDGHITLLQGKVQVLEERLASYPPPDESEDLFHTPTEKELAERDARIDKAIASIKRLEDGIFHEFMGLVEEIQSLHEEMKLKDAQVLAALHRARERECTAERLQEESERVLSRNQDLENDAIVKNAHLEEMQHNLSHLKIRCKRAEEDARARQRETEDLKERLERAQTEIRDIDAELEVIVNLFKAQASGEEMGEQARLQNRFVYFHTMALGLKTSLGRQREIGNVFIDDLYEEATRLNVPERDWPEFIRFALLDKSHPARA